MFHPPAVRPSMSRAAVPIALACALAFPPAASAAAPAPAAAPVAIRHDDVACIVAERHPRVEACVTPADRVGRAQIHFRANSEGPWYAVDLKPEGECLRGLLPRPLKTTRAVQYYVDVMDRAFTERRQPERAPEVAYTARVVGTEADCAKGRMAAWVTRTAQPVVVSAARDASGRALGTAVLNALDANAAVPGFSAEGIVMAPPPEAVGRGGQSSSARSGSGAGAAAGGAAAAGGIGLTTLAIAGGAVAAAGIAVAAASGGGENGPGGDGGGDVDLTGRWEGPWTSRFTAFGTTTTCVQNITMDLRHSGGTFSGTGSSSNTTCGGFEGGSGSGTLSGTASGGRIAFTVPFPDSGCPPFQYTGTYTANAMSGNLASSCTIQGTTVVWSGEWTATRR
jgi:hypothetical protein